MFDKRYLSDRPALVILDCSTGTMKRYQFMREQRREKTPEGNFIYRDLHIPKENGIVQFENWGTQRLREGATYEGVMSFRKYGVDVCR